MTFADVPGGANEELHRIFHWLHHEIRAVQIRIGGALLLLHTIETASKDCREQAREVIAEVEKLRDTSERLLLSAAELKSKLVKEHGCTGACGE